MINNTNVKEYGVYLGKYTPYSTIDDDFPGDYIMFLASKYVSSIEYTSDSYDGRKIINIVTNER